MDELINVDNSGLEVVRFPLYLQFFDQLVFFQGLVHLIRLFNFFREVV